MITFKGLSVDRCNSKPQYC